MKNASDGFISRLDTTEERISELEDVSQGSSNTEQKLKRKTEQNRISGGSGTATRGIAYP